MMYKGPVFIRESSSGEGSELRDVNENLIAKLTWVNPEDLNFIVETMNAGIPAMACREGSKSAGLSLAGVISDLSASMVLRHRDLEQQIREQQTRIDSAFSHIEDSRHGWMAATQALYEKIDEPGELTLGILDAHLLGRLEDGTAASEKIDDLIRKRIDSWLESGQFDTDVEEALVDDNGNPTDGFYELVRKAIRGIL